MSSRTVPTSEPVVSATEEHIEIDLKDPAFAAFLAWLMPGLGHWYQGRTHKAVIFFVCVFGTFVYGLYLGEGRVVYASWRDNDHRLFYLCQVGVGLPALPALIQARREQPVQFPIYKDFMAPPKIVGAGPNDPDSLDGLQKRLSHFWEMGTVYTAIAGLLNILVIYDAWGGPAYSIAGKKEDDEKPDSGGEKEDKP
ncbi:MAG TPA: DUF6677 family protein [Pirellulales bacterium]|nr:DUF6677 family protein [Pirellulales bacterium]